MVDVPTPGLKTRGSICLKTRGSKTLNLGAGLHQLPGQQRRAGFKGFDVVTGRFATDEVTKIGQETTRLTLGCGQYGRHSLIITGVVPFTRRGTAAMVLMVLGATVASAQIAPPPAQTPVPKPFPTGTQAGAPAKPSVAPPVQSPVAGNGASIDPLLATSAIYTAAEFLESFDAGDASHSQRVFVFGTNDAYEAVVAFYKTQLRKNGEEVVRAPRVHQFDVGAFDARTMPQRPSVIVKDYTSPDPAGYLHVAGTKEKRFRTLIQIIPAVK